ncbi:hypothetical protein BGZ65_007547, partial [Modicella reniformis]
MNNNSDELSHTFRNQSTGDVTNIPAVTDPKTGKHIILWRDIQDGFEKAKAIWNGKTPVPFMIDENLEHVIPLRIAYYQGVVLDVVMETTISTGEAVCLSQILSAGKEESNQTVATPAIADHMIYPNTIPEVSQSSILAQNLLHNNLLQTIMSSQVISIHSIDRLQIEMDKLHEKVDQIQQHMDINQQLQQHTSEELIKKQDEMTQMQEQALHRLAIIQNRVQAVVTQNYELHEYPIPRLFIILPKAVGLRDKFKSLFSDQFRL